jgi:hypothetical protein
MKTNTKQPCDTFDEQMLSTPDSVPHEPLGPLCPALHLHHAKNGTCFMTWLPAFNKQQA